MEQLRPSSRSQIDVNGPLSAEIETRIYFIANVLSHESNSQSVCTLTNSIIANTRMKETCIL